MRRSDFNYVPPQELIAQRPPARRTDSRLLVMTGVQGELSDRRFSDLPELVTSNDLLVFNDTRVIRARLYGRKDTGGQVEVLIERILDGATALVQVRASKSPKPGGEIIFGQDIMASVIDREGDFFRLRFEGCQDLYQLMEDIGHVPLPPYIERADEDLDRDRYQTVFATSPGAVAAPTAGLHFDSGLLDRLTQKGIRRTFITLHVGAGTFQPVRVDDVTSHRMHAERVEVPEHVCEQIVVTRERGGRVVAVGTTVVRALESAAAAGGLPRAFNGETDMFIYPGYRFRCVDALITNFHLPESTLLMLVCAFAGRGKVLNAYQHAIAKRYRFYSYGDAMFLTPTTEAQSDEV